MYLASRRKSADNPRFGAELLQVSCDESVKRVKDLSAVGKQETFSKDQFICKDSV